MVNDVNQQRPTSPPWLVLVVFIDLLIAVGAFLVVAVVAPDDGLTSTSLRQGIVLAVVFAAAPIAALARGIDSASLVALGGGMMVAGAAATPGGNLLGPVMAFEGLLLLLVGASGQPKLTARLIGWLLVYSVMFRAAAWLALDAMVGTGLAAAVALAVVIAISTHRRRSEPDRH